MIGGEGIATSCQPRSWRRPRWCGQL